MAGLHFDITGDNSNFMRKLNETRNGVQATSKQIEDSGMSIEQMFGRMTTAAAAFGISLGAKQLVSDITRVRGEFQQLEVAFNTMLGSKEQADTLMSQLVRTAAITPFDLQGVANGAKQLLAYGTEAKDVNATLIRLGDISAGLSIPLNDLVYLYGTTMTQGRLFTMDLRQFQGRGIPLADELAKQFGVAKDKVGELVTAGKVGFPEVQKAIEAMTNEGGKFGGLMEAQSKTITGQISNIEDAIATMFNEIGKDNEGIINTVLGGVSSLVENYEKVGEAIAVAITAYGTYKAALMTVSALQAANNIILKQAVVEKHLAAAAGITLSNSEAIAAARTKILTIAQQGLVKALKAAAAATVANPYVLLAAAVTGLAFALYKVVTAETEAETATRMYNEALDEQQKKQDEYKDNIDKLIKAIEDNNKSEGERLQAFEALKAEYPTVLNNLLTEAEYLKEIAKYKQLIAEEDNNRVKQSDEEILEEEERKLRSLQQRVDNFRKQHPGINDDSWRWGGTMDKYNAQIEIVNKQKAKVTSHDVSSFLGSIKDMKDNDIASTISGITTSLQALGKSGDDAIAIVTELGGEFSKSQLSTIKNALETEQKARSGEKNTGKGWIEKYKNAYLTAKKELDDFLNTNNTLSEIEYENKLKELTEKKEEAEKKYKSVGGATESALTKQDNQTEELRKQTDKYNALLDKQSLEQQRSAEDLQMQVDEARIKAMDEGSAKTIAEMELNFEKEMQAIDRQKEDALRKKIENARAAWDANPESNGKSFDAAGIELSDSETKYFDELYKAAIANDEKIYSNLANEYLSYTDERLAIEKKFNDDIALLQESRKKAESKGNTDEVAKIDRSIGKRTETKNEDIFKLDAEQFKKNMNWEQVFGNLDKVSTDTLKKLKANLKDFISSQKDLSPENLKELVDAIERIDDKVTERNPFDAMSSSFKSLKEATDAQREAQEAYNKALKEGTDEEKKNAKATLESAKNNKQKALSEATTALHHGVDEIGQYVDAGNQVIGIMETLGIKTPEWLEGTMSGFGEMLDGLGNIDLMKPMSIVTGSLQTIKGALTSITSLGGVINWNGSNAKDVQDSINRLTDRNEALQTSIESLTDEIKSSKGTKSVAAYRDAYEYQKEQDANYLNIAREQARYHNSHKSWRNYMKWSNEDLKWIQQNVSKSFSGTSSLWGLTPEEMEKLRSNVDIWTKMQSAGKGGYGERVTDKLDDYIEQAGKLEELTNALYEGLTAISFDSMYDSFVDNLMDMKYDAKAAAEDISEYFMRAMLSNKIGELYSDKLEEWWKKFGASMEDNELTEAERKALQDEYMGYVEEAMKLRDELAAATGYDKISQESTSQSSTSRGFGTEMTHEDAGELSGRFTALQIAGEETKNAMLSMLAIANTLSVSANSNGVILLEIKNLMITSNGHLEDIAKYTKELIGFKQAITNIENSAKAMAGK